MEITSLKLLNFRNFSKLDLNFYEKKNIIIGNNGEGKTNIIEAIFTLALTKSFRTNDDSTLIKDGNNLYKIEGKIKSTFINDYKLVYQDNIKTVKINNNKISKLSDYISNILVVIFSINDLKLIKDTPSTRRKLLNLEISQINNIYLKYVNYYNKILKQRNNYLKKVFNREINKEYINILDDKLIEYGIKINEFRNNFINQINEVLSETYKKIGIDKKLSIFYKSDYNGLDSVQLKKIYNDNIGKDKNLGSTQIGVHHDDFIFYIDDYEAKFYASEGQQKSAVIAFKLAELELFKQTKGEYPILILDDLFSELDTKKIEKILNYINIDIQTFITTTDLKKIKKVFLKESKIFEIKDGQIKEDFYE